MNAGIILRILCRKDSMWYNVIRREFETQEARGIVQDMQRNILPNEEITGAEKNV